MGINLTPEQQAEAAGLVAAYITQQRQTFMPQGFPLSGVQLATMKAFFAPKLLEATRLVVLTRARIQNPAFYYRLARMGISNLPDFAHMAAVTFNDVVVSHGPFSDQLLFHELVHVEQYRQLGIQRFAELYVRGFLTGGSYERIPLEIMAYDLDRRFARNPGRKFFVANEVSSRISGGKV